MTDESSTSEQGQSPDTPDTVASPPRPRESADADEADASVEESGKRTRSPRASYKDTESIEGFSVAASKLYFTLVNRYFVDLERFSRLKARDGSVESVSSQHVKQAATFLSSARVISKSPRYCETAGGILLGAGISELIILIQSNKFSAGLVVITSILIGIGAVMIGIFLGRD